MNDQSLTPLRRCGTVAGKESRSSQTSGIRTRQLADFLCPRVFTSGGRQLYKTRKGKLPAVWFRFLASRHPQVRRLETSPCAFLINRRHFHVAAALYRVFFRPLPFHHRP